MGRCDLWLFFFFNDTATTEIYTLSLHDALPISSIPRASTTPRTTTICAASTTWLSRGSRRSEEHTSELQSLTNLVCRLLLDKKKRPQVQQHTSEHNRSIHQPP